MTPFAYAENGGVGRLESGTYVFEKYSSSGESPGEARDWVVTGGVIASLASRADGLEARRRREVEGFMIVHRDGRGRSTGEDI